MLCVCKMAHAPGAKPVAQRQAAPAMGAAAEGGSGLDDELQVGLDDGSRGWIYEHVFFDRRLDWFELWFVDLSVSAGWCLKHRSVLLQLLCPEQREVGAPA